MSSAVTDVRVIVLVSGQKIETSTITPGKSILGKVAKGIPVVSSRKTKVE